MAASIAIVGGGRVGAALLAGFQRAGRVADVAPRDAAGQRALVRARDLIVLAVPHDARRAVVEALGDALDGKVLVDVTNPVAFPGPRLLDVGAGSGAEELQAWAPRARVVKAFSTVFSRAMSTARVAGEPTGAFVATDDDAARALVLELARDAGFDATDAGPLSNARWLEHLVFFEMLLEAVHGSDIGWRLQRAAAPRG